MLEEVKGDLNLPKFRSIFTLFFMQLTIFPYAQYIVGIGGSLVLQR